MSGPARETEQLPKSVPSFGALLPRKAGPLASPLASPAATGEGTNFASADEGAAGRDEQQGPPTQMLARDSHHPPAPPNLNVELKTGLTDLRNLFPSNVPPSGLAGEPPHTNIEVGGVQGASTENSGVVR